MPLPAHVRAAARFQSLAADHWPFAVVLTAGAALRALAWAAYQPALFYPDSTNYLANVHRVPNVAWHPPGYVWFLDATLVGRHLAIVTAVQHLLVLADGVVIYLLLRRLRCGRVVATVAAAPALLDAYQIQIEQYILSEAVFESLLVAAVAVALWPGHDGRPRPGVLRIAITSTLIGLSVLVRLDAVGLVVPLLGWIAWTLHRRRSRALWSTVTAVALAAVLALAAPLGVVVGLRHSSGGGTTITGSAPIWLYARVAGFADCAHDSIPADERALCPTEPIGHRPGPVWFQDSASSPAWVYLELDHGQLNRVEAFAKHVIRQQRLDYTHAVLADFAQQFRPSRAQTPGGPEVQSWHFRLTLAPVDPTKPVAQDMVDRYGTGSARIDVGVARVLRDYQRFAYLPGPVMAVLLAFGLVVLVVRRRHPLAPALLLTLGAAVLTVLVATATVLFSWRYMLPTLLLYPPAGALAWAMVRSSLPAPASRQRDDAAPADLDSSSDSAPALAE